MTDLKKNFIYNVAYQILILILPIITIPYVSRVLGATGIGTYSYSYSIASAFALFMLLGINNYGNRMIARCRDDKEEVSKKFWGIYILQVTMSLLVIFLYMLYVNFFYTEYRIVSNLQIIYLLGVAIDINWFFFGMEKFKVTVMRNTIVKLVSFICILLFVKKTEDIYIYTAIMACSTFISNLFLAYNLKKYVKRVSISSRDIISNLKPCLILFIPVIAFGIFRIMDKVMLGHMAGVIEVGYYENADKIINIPLGIITAAGTVLLPRMSNMLAKGKDISIYLEKALKFILFLAIPIMFGLIAVADNFVPLFLGNEFSKTAKLLKLLSIVTVIMAWSNMIKTSYLIPKERDKEFTISLILGAIVNFVLNIILIPKIKSEGAAIGTIFAELVVAIYQTYYIRKEISLYKLFKEAIKMCASATIMFLCISTIPHISNNTILVLILQVALGVMIYFIINIKYILSLLNIKHKTRKE